MKRIVRIALLCLFLTGCVTLNNKPPKPEEPAVQEGYVSLVLNEMSMPTRQTRANTRLFSDLGQNIAVAAANSFTGLVVGTAVGRTTGNAVGSSLDESAAEAIPAIEVHVRLDSGKSWSTIRPRPELESFNFQEGDRVRITRDGLKESIEKLAAATKQQ